jgi:hypothetical protein
MNKINKIKKFFDKEISKDLKDIMLLEVSDGSYLAFGKYSITPKDDCFEIKTIKEPWKRCPIVSDLKIAIAWCIYDKYIRVKEANRLPEIDIELSGIKVSLAILQQKLKKSKDSSDKFIYLAKIQETKYRKSMILSELNDYLITSMRWQKDKFDKIKTKIS